ncbi:hypothetical protein LX36DRAFT_336575 [Colletotrichum falcatum]|nr:hypothetical protein LX36DRAFT_336575 [Colletotrichum falcatum]
MGGPGRGRGVGLSRPCGYRRPKQPSCSLVAWPGMVLFPVAAAAPCECVCVCVCVYVCVCAPLYEYVRVPVCLFFVYACVRRRDCLTFVVCMPAWPPPPLSVFLTPFLPISVVDLLAPSTSCPDTPSSLPYTPHQFGEDSLPHPRQRCKCTDRWQPIFPELECKRKQTGGGAWLWLSAVKSLLLPRGNYRIDRDGRPSFLLQWVRNCWRRTPHPPCSLPIEQTLGQVSLY